MMTLLREAFLQIDADMSDSIEWDEFVEYCIANASTAIQKETAYQIPDVTVRHGLHRCITLAFKRTDR
jgi:hypothetical protein